MCVLPVASVRIAAESVSCADTHAAESPAIGVDADHPSGSTCTFFVNQSGGTMNWFDPTFIHTSATAVVCSS